MLHNRLFYFRQLPWFLLATILVIIHGCNSTGLTRKQQEALEENLDFVADAIHFSASKIQQPLSDFYNRHGTWPVSVSDQQQVLGSIDRILVEHGVASARLLTIDKYDILVDYKFSRQHSLRFPALLESWSILFSNKNDKRLEVIAVYPTWSDPEKLAEQLSYSVQLVKDLQTAFKQRLQGRLSGYSLTLNENLNEPI
ncbi:MAG: hypothetical protein AMJ55_04765 [Gammaproteobacteria bacterium SG8_15]|nr:MAG: hypothetical protein AMJ55_04765 [Gammaproteobacteria bacterium SG8_15]